jgi:hypothetical protein
VRTAPGGSISFSSTTAETKAMTKANNRVSVRGDLLLWREAMRSVTPLRGRAARPMSSPGRRIDKQSCAAVGAQRFSGIDRANANAKRGLHPIRPVSICTADQPRLIRSPPHIRRPCRRRTWSSPAAGLSSGPGVLKRRSGWLEEVGLRGKSRDRTGSSAGWRCWRAISSPTSRGGADRDRASYQVEPNPSGSRHRYSRARNRANRKVSARRR